jgi:hypothetical protein
MIITIPLLTRVLTHPLLFKMLWLSRLRCLFKILIKNDYYTTLYGIIMSDKQAKQTKICQKLNCRVELQLEVEQLTILGRFNPRGTHIWWIKNPFFSTPNSNIPSIRLIWIDMKDTTTTFWSSYQPTIIWTFFFAFRGILKVSRVKYALLCIIICNHMINKWYIKG